MGRKLLHLLNGLITCAVVAALVIAGAYAGYALWDNQQVYDAAENSLSEMQEIRSTLGMPTTVSALTELLEESRAARKAKAEATAAPAPEITAAPAEPVQAVPETATPADAADNTSGTTVTVTDEIAGDADISIPAQTETTETTEITETATAETTETTETAETTEAPTAAPTEEPIDDSLFGQEVTTVSATETETADTPNSEETDEKEIYVGF